MLIEFVNVAILALLAVTALAAIRLHDLFAVAMMFGIYSLLASVMFVVLDAIDVAFTEAAVGVGISTVLMLGTIGLVGRHEKTCTPTAAATAGGIHYGRGSGLWDAGHATLYGSCRAGSPACRALLPERVARANRHSERGHEHFGELPRLRHPRRTRGHLHRRNRRAGHLGIAPAQAARP